MRFSKTALLGAFVLSALKVCDGKPSPENIIDLGTIRPEGIAILPELVGLSLRLGVGPIAIRSELFWGGVEAINLKTGASKQIVERAENFFFSEDGKDKAMAIGIKYYNGHVFVCGGFGLNVRAYDIFTGEVVANCPVAEGGFINDLTFIGETAYITNSFDGNIATLDVYEALHGNCVSGSIPLKSFPTDYTSFNANGIVPYKNGLLIANYYLGGVYYHALGSNKKVVAVIPQGTAVGGDGLAITSDETKLFVCQNQFQTGGFGSDAISVYGLDDDGKATLETELGNRTTFDAPTTCALTDKEDFIYFVNARFASIGFPADGEADLSTFDKKFTMIGLDVSGFVAGRSSGD